MEVCLKDDVEVVLDLRALRFSGLSGILEHLSHLFASSS